MSRYQWPAQLRPKDDAIRRMDYNADTTGAVVGPGPAELAALKPAPKAPPADDANLWVPIGPSVVMHGQAGDRPRVAGRVRDIAVSPDGQRAYAATANGGVWFTGDAGATWAPLGNWFPTPSTVPTAVPAQMLTCGCLLVTFGGAGDGSADDVYVGTGELVPELDRGFPGAKLGGFGVLHLNSTVPAALANPFGEHWKREAKNLTGAGIYRLARDPGAGAPNTIVAATSKGLFARTGAFVEDAEWPQIKQGDLDFDATSGKVTTDVAWARTAPQRLWVALANGTNTKVYASTNGIAGPFNPVNLPGVQPGRLAIALAPSNDAILYVLGDGQVPGAGGAPGSRLWQINGVTPVRVQNLPNSLFMSASNQSSYDMCLAVHPTNPNTVIVGGAATLADNEWSGAIFRFNIVPAGGGLNAGFLAANQPAPANDATYIGHLTHSDVHQIVYRSVGAAVHVWVCCDGGVFRSTAGGDKYSFLSRNTGLAILEAGYLTNHPVSDSFVIAGAQDNGAVLRVGDTVWSFSDAVGGDGGCVLIHPVQNRFFAGQYVAADWRSNGTLSPPVLRHPQPYTTSEKNENGRSFGYSTADVRRVGAGPQVRLALGTNRVWLADNWNPGAPAATGWVTIPSNTDPRTGTVNDDRDAVGDKTGSVVAVRWVDDNRLLMMMRSGQPDGSDSVVRLLTRQPDGKYTTHDLSNHHNKCSDFTNSDISSSAVSDYLPPLGAWSDIAVHTAGPGNSVSCYVACTGHVARNGSEADRMDTLWWYDGAGKWHATGLRVMQHSTPGTVNTKAPAYAVVVDPSDTNVVYVGTAVGVWKGALSFDASTTPPTPLWVLRPFMNGLPEAPVQDLSFYHPGPDGLHPGPKLLRAAIQARGVWEVDLSTPAGPVKRTYLRVHPTDARRAETTSLVNPMLVGPVNWAWHASPDIRIRPAPPTGAEAAPMFPAGPPVWAGAVPAAVGRFALWTFQTALHRTDPLSRPDGNWSNQFAARLRALPGGGNNINAVRWGAVVTAANVFADPWDGTEPTEADLFELIVERGQLVPDPIFGPPQITIAQPRRNRVTVLVHHRDVRPVRANEVKVCLLRRTLPADQATWAGIAISADWKNKVVQLIGGSPVALPDGWSNADVTFTNLSPASDVDARLPRAVTFTVDFTGIPTAAPFTRIMLLAVVQSTPDPLSVASLVGDTLQNLILRSHQIAARVVEIQA